MKKLLCYISLTVFCIFGFSACASDSTGVTSSMPDEFDVEIHIDYIESTGFNYRDDAYVFLDGEEIGVIENGSSEVFSSVLEGGKHEIHLKRKTTLRKYNTNKIEFDVSSDKNVYITAEENTISGLRIKLTE